jgi:hypothetical protein
MNLLIVAACIGLAVLFVVVALRRMRNRLLRRMRAGVNGVLVATYCRLKARYEVELEHQAAGLLAGGVTSVIFNQLPAHEEGAKFQVAHGDLMARKLAELKGDSFLRHAVTQALRVRSMLDARGTRQSEPDVSLESLTMLGLLVPGGEPPTPATFLPLVMEYGRAAQLGFDPDTRN